MRLGRILGALPAFAVALAAAAGAAWLAAPERWRIALGLAEPAAPEPSGGGWGAAAAAPEPPPLVDLSGLAWMAWTPETGAFFLSILAALALMTGIEIAAPGGGPRKGVLGLVTTRGDRLFLTLLGAAFLSLGWLGLAGPPLWGGLALAALWGVFVFWKV